MNEDRSAQRLLMEAVDDVTAPDSLVRRARKKVVRRRWARRAGAGAAAAAVIAVAGVLATALQPPVTPQIDPAAEAPATPSDTPPDTSGPDGRDGSNGDTAVDSQIVALREEVAQLEAQVRNGSINRADLTAAQDKLISRIETLRDSLEGGSTADLGALTDLEIRLLELAAGDATGTPEVEPVGTWSTTGDHPLGTPVAAADTEGTVIALGTDGGTPTAARLDVDSGSWQTLPVPGQQDWQDLNADGHLQAVGAGRDLILIGGGEALVVLRYSSADGTWTRAADAPIKGRTGAGATWTGEQLLLWGGFTARDGGIESVFSDGAAWSPASDTWQQMPDGPLQARGEPTMVWDGSQAHVVLGGALDGDPEAARMWPSHLSDAATYDPASQVWADPVDLQVSGPPAAAVWTGEQVVVWNGALQGAPQTPDVASWTPSTGEIGTYAGPGAGALTQRRDGPTPSGWHDGTGQLVVWGGVCGEGCLASHRDGAALDLTSGSWRPLATAPNNVTTESVGVWGGQRMVVLNPDGTSTVWTP